MGWFRRKESRSTNGSAFDAAIGNLFEPLEILEHLDKRLPDYLKRADTGEFIYPACKRTISDPAGDIRSIWDHTRLEAMRYVMMVPGRKFELLISPERQEEMLGAFLREHPHENTVIDFTGITVSDYAIAIIAGLNWLQSCAHQAGAHPDKFFTRHATSESSRP